jgi:hypothetical protein
MEQPLPAFAICIQNQQIAPPLLSLHGNIIAEVDGTEDANPIRVVEA